MKGRESVLRILREMEREGRARARERRWGERRAGAGGRAREGLPAEAGRWMGVGLAVGAFLLGLGAALLVSGRE